MYKYKLVFILLHWPEIQLVDFLNWQLFPDFLTKLGLHQSNPGEIDPVCNM